MLCPALLLGAARERMFLANGPHGFILVSSGLERMLQMCKDLVMDSETDIDISIVEQLSFMTISVTQEREGLTC